MSVHLFKLQLPNVSPQEEGSLELGNIESVLVLEQNCFTHAGTLEAARQAEVEVLPLLEVYCKRHLTVGEPVLPETIHCFPQGWDRYHYSNNL